MNQGYLTQWPRRYPDVVRLDHPGLNLAPWNFEGRAFKVEDGGILVDGMPLIFYHFHDMKRKSGVWRNASSMIDSDRHPDLFKMIYDPHKQQLKAIEKRLAGFGFDIKAPLRSKMDPALVSGPISKGTWQKKLMKRLAVPVRKVFSSKDTRN